MECLDVCVVNASIIHNCLKPSEKMALKDFKRGVIAGLIESSGIRKRSLQVQDMPSTSSKRQKTRVSVEVRQDKSDHLPVASFGGPGGGVAPPKEQLAPPKAAAGGLGGASLGASLGHWETLTVLPRAKS